jgi:CBS domain-containing protein
MGSVLSNKASRPPISVPRTMTVSAAVRLMADKRIGAVLVLEEGRAAGIFTERDLMIKVVLKGLDPERTALADVLTTPVIPIREDAGLDEAVHIMLSKHIRHLPLVDHDGKVQGMLSMRNLVAAEIDELKQSVRGLEAYVGYDGAGG